MPPHFIKDWQDSPILTTLTTTAYPVDNIDFPAVTICASGMNEEVFNAAFLQQFFDYLKQRNLIGSNISRLITPFEAQKLLFIKVT